MKNIFYIFAFVLFLSACTESKEEIVTSIETKPNVLANAETKFNIEGMTCAHGCAAKIEEEIAKMDGVSSSKVNFDTKIATISFNDKVVTKEDFIKKIQSVGDQYKATEIIDNTQVNGDTESNVKTETITEVITSTGFQLPNILDFFTNIF